MSGRGREQSLTLEENEEAVQPRGPRHPRPILPTSGPAASHMPAGAAAQGLLTISACLKKSARGGIQAMAQRGPASCMALLLPCCGSLVVPEGEGRGMLRDSAESESFHDHDHDYDSRVKEHDRKTIEIRQMC